VLQIGKTIISLDVVEKQFICDLSVCRGDCCVQGDSGAPLEKIEMEILDNIYEKIKGFLREEGIKTIEDQGKHIIDNDGDIVTPLIDNKECAYTIFEEGIVRCGIEKAFYAGEIDFIKPQSCHLFPVRITEYKKFDAVNYKPTDRCKCAIILGDINKIPVYKFLKDPLIRKYGKHWYKKLEIAAESLLNKGNL